MVSKYHIVLFLFVKNFIKCDANILQVQ